MLHTIKRTHSEQCFHFVRQIDKNRKRLRLSICYCSANLHNTERTHTTGGVSGHLLIESTLSQSGETEVGFVHAMYFSFQKCSELYLREDVVCNDYLCRTILFQFSSNRFGA